MKPPHVTRRDKQAGLVQDITSHREVGDTELRFNRTWVAASDIASQYYCEQKVELQLQLGEVETEAKLLGSAAHAELAADAVETDRLELFRHIFSDRVTVVQEMLVLVRYKGLILLGQPDAIIFQHGSARYIFEFKFSLSPIPYHSYLVQVNVYGKILEGMGFDVSHLFHVIAIIPPAARHDTTTFPTIMESVITNSPQESNLDVGAAKVYIYPYRPREAEDDIDWALEYWRSRRGAIPTQNPNKCARCEYQSSCTVKPGNGQSSR